MKLIFSLMMMCSFSAGAVSYSPLGYEGDIRNLWVDRAGEPMTMPEPNKAVADAVSTGAASVNDCGNQLAAQQKAIIDKEGQSNRDRNPDGSETLSCLAKYSKYSVKTGLSLPEIGDLTPSLPIPSLSALVNIKDMVCAFEQQQMAKALAPLSSKMPKAQLPGNKFGGSGGVSTTLGGGSGSQAPNQSTGTGFTPIQSGAPVNPLK